MPKAARNKSRPTPGHPLGNVGNILCSGCLLGIFRNAATTPSVKDNGALKGANP